MCKSLLRAVYSYMKSIRQSSKNCKQTARSMEPRYDFNRQWTLPPRSEMKHLNKFKVLSYNILAQELLLTHLHLYMHHRQERLTWRQRFHNIQREIIKLSPDILCLQEMQYDHLPYFVEQLTVCSGKRLEYIYKKKTGSKPDGCAIIYDSCKFKLLNQQAVELYDATVPLLNRENVALLAKFRLKQSQNNVHDDEPKEVIVATTHLLYNPRRDDVRCAQVHRLLRELHIFSDNSDGEHPNRMTPVILTGDFNSEIDTSPIMLLTRRETEPSALNMKIIDPGECTASTHQDKWTTVDYILHSECPQSKHRLKVLSVYMLPHINTCAHVGFIPNHYLGSDHYSLGAVFALA